MDVLYDDRAERPGVKLKDADLTAALVGKRFGKHPFFGKSLEGSAAFFGSALLVVAILPKIEYRAGEYAIGATAALAGAGASAPPKFRGARFSVTPICGFFR